MSVETWTSREIGSSGGFIRQVNRFTKPFGSGKDQLPVESGRYRLIWSQACPWAHRSVIVRKLLGLESALSLGTVDPIRPKGPRSDWAFTVDESGLDPVLRVAFVSDVYKKADPDYQGRCTVPVVVDLQTGAAVNNDYFRLTRYWEVEWRAYHKPGAPELYPAGRRAEIDELNEALFDEVNNGVYKVGFARTQAAYDEALATLFARLDRLEDILSGRRFLLGDFITEPDIRLYVTLARFDAAYYNGFRANVRALVDYPNLWAYARDLYQTPGFGDTTGFSAIKRHYHLCAVPGNEFRIVPRGPDLSLWSAPSGRETLSSSPARKFETERSEQ